MWPRVPIITHAVRASQGPDPPRQARHSDQTGHPRGPPGHLAGAEGEGKVSASAHGLAETAQEEEEPRVQVEETASYSCSYGDVCTRSRPRMSLWRHEFCGSLTWLVGGASAAVLRAMVCW